MGCVSDFQDIGWVRRTKSLLTPPTTTPPLPHSVHKVPVNPDECWSGSTLGGWCVKTLSVRAHQMLCKYSGNRSWPPNNAGRLVPWEHSADFWDAERRKFSFRLLRVCSESSDGMISRRQTKSSMSSTCCVWSWMIYERSTARRTCTECEGLICSSAIEGIYRDDAYTGTELWNEAGSVNFYWKTSPFNRGYSTEKHFNQLLFVLACSRKCRRIN